jgi:hypothetical protein
LVVARSLHERALAIREKVLGPDHPTTARSLNSLGVVLRFQGDLAAARPLYERASAITEKALGPGHLDTARSLKIWHGCLGSRASWRRPGHWLSGAWPSLRRSSGQTTPTPRAFWTT